MNIIMLKDDGRLEHQDKPVKNSPLMYTGFQIELNASCRLRSFFNMLAAHPILAELNPFIPVFLDQFKRCPASACRGADIDCLVLSRTVEMIGAPGEPRMQLYVSLEGIRDETVVPIKSYWLDNLLDLPLKLGSLKHLVFGDKLDTFAFDTAFNLFELIDGICWELSFHNLPAECRIDL